MRCTRTPALRISLAVVKEVQACLEALLRADESKIMAHRVAAFKKAGVPFPELSTSQTLPSMHNFKPGYQKWCADCICPSGIRSDFGGANAKQIPDQIKRCEVIIC
ncbi:Hypothetical protein PHPALM_14002, partial [Phytophthora palmivora]